MSRWSAFLDRHAPLMPPDVSRLDLMERDGVPDRVDRFMDAACIWVPLVGLAVVAVLFVVTVVVQIVMVLT